MVTERRAEVSAGAASREVLFEQERVITISRDEEDLFHLEIPDNALRYRIFKVTYWDGPFIRSTSYFEPGSHIKFIVGPRDGLEFISSPKGGKKGSDIRVLDKRKWCSVPVGRG